jgi:hypothetical protein
MHEGGLAHAHAHVHAHPFPSVYSLYPKACRFGCSTFFLCTHPDLFPPTSATVVLVLAWCVLVIFSSCGLVSLQAFVAVAVLLLGATDNPQNELC